MARLHGLLPISLLYICIHAAFFLHDLRNPSAFLVGDRSAERMEKVLAFDSVGGHLRDLFTGSFPGDFAVHALLYHLGGQYFVIAAQVLVQFAALILVYVAAERLAGARVAIVSTMLFVVMPGALMNPHQLVTDAWFTSFLSAGTVLCCLAVGENRTLRSPFALTAGFLLFAAAAFFRPQGLLVPLAIGVILLLMLTEHRRTVLGSLALGYLVFPLSLMAFRLAAVGEFNLGAWGGDLGVNLSMRANRILSLPAVDPGLQKLTIAEFLRIALAHPAAAVKSFYADAANVILNPGSNQVFGQYLGLFDPNADVFHWHETLDRSGLAGVISEIMRQDAAFIATFAIWTAIHAIVLVGVAIVCIRAVTGRRSIPTWLWLVLIAVGVSTASIFAAGLVRWGHRSGFEPLLALLAAWGISGRPATARTSDAPQLAARTAPTSAR